MGRAPCCDKANVKKGPWSPEEDRKLKEYIEKYGTGGNWIALPHKAGLKRCGKSCRLRWLNYLRPNIKHGDFSDDEDRIICNLFASIGSRWSIIAAQLPGRTDNDIKNYWNTKLKKKILGLPPTHRKSAQTQLHQKPQQQLSFFSSPLETSTTLPPFLYSTHSLEGVPISPYLCNTSNTNILPSNVVAKGAVHGLHARESGTLLMFGGDQSCSSSDLSYSKGIDFDVSNIGAGEQLGFESYLFGSLEEAQKLILGGSNNGEGEAPPLMEYNNYNEEIKPLGGLNNECNLLYTADEPTNTVLKNQERFLF